MKFKVNLLLLQKFPRAVHFWPEIKLTFQFLTWFNFRWKFLWQKYIGCISRFYRISSCTRKLGDLNFNCLAIYLAVCAGLNSSLEMDLPTVFQAYWARPTFEFRILVNNSWTISYICSKRLANNTYFWYYNQTIKKTVKIKLSKNQNNLLNGNSELVLGS